MCAAAQLCVDDRPDCRKGDGVDSVQALLEFEHKLGIEEAGARRNELAELDIGRTQPLKQPPQQHLFRFRVMLQGY